MSQPLVVALAIAVSFVTCAARPARAADFSCDLTVVGFDTKGSVLVRRECSGSVASIALVTVDLATGKQKGAIDIVERDTPDEERERVRAKRWKAAEASLTKDGFTIDPKRHTRADGDKLGVSGLVLKGERVSQDDESGMSGIGYTVTAMRGNASALLLAPVFINVNDHSSWDGYYVSPDKRYILLLENGPGAKTHVFEVVKVLEMLKPVPPQPKH